MKTLKSLLLASALVSPMAAPAVAETDIEVLHHWVSESEVKALNVIRNALAEKGYGWKDSAVGGQSGANALQALRTRIAAGNPPAVMQFLGYEGIDWASEGVDWSGEGVLRNLRDLADKNGWQATIAPQVLPFIQTGDKLFAVPINMHRQNWVWANKAALDKAGVAEPKTWGELIASGDKLRAAGVIPLAMGDEPWQIELIFDSLVADLYGPEFYKKALIDLDPKALSGPEMKDVFDKLRQVRGLVDDNITGRDWAVATDMVMTGKAAMQVMGDWAKGEFLAKGLKPGSDFLCFATPSDTTSFLFVIDTFGMFSKQPKDVADGQVVFAEVVMDPKIQHDFNLIKGSIPARLDVPVDDYDDCAKASFADRKAAVENGAMLGALTHGFASRPEFGAVFSDVVAQFFVTDMSSEEAVQRLVDGIDNAR